MSGSDRAAPAAWARRRPDVVRHYERLLREHGATAHGMEWKDEASQRLRFDVLCEVCGLEGRTLHEVGAGAGHLVDHLAARGIGAHYSGSDVAPAMVEAARARHPDHEFAVGDLFDDHRPEAHDVVVASGVFNVRMDESDEAWGEYVREAVRRMWRRCRVAIAFNLMSDHVDFRKPILYHADAGEMLDFCRRELSRYVVLRHDYPLYEYTIYVYRRPPERLGEPLGSAAAGHSR